MMRIIIDNKEFFFKEPKSILEIALEKGVYIPHLCYRRGLSPAKGERAIEEVFQGVQSYRGTPNREYEGCCTCLVEVEGKGILHSCVTIAENDMVVQTSTEQVKNLRRENIGRILKRHPHDCLICEQADGCDRKICSKHIREENRCCWKFGTCELQKIVNFVGIDDRGIEPYRAKGSPIIDDNPLFTRNYDLCIGCLRCVVACRELTGVNALGFIQKDGDIIVGTTAKSLKKSGCKYCLVCVEVCPTGAIRDKNPKKKKSKIRAEIPQAIFPPEVRLVVLKPENIEKVPQAEGVYRLWTRRGDLYQITGTDTLKTSLMEELKSKEGTHYFDYEENLMFTTRERQLIQKHLKKFGRLPPGNDEDDSLF